MIGHKKSDGHLAFIGEHEFYVAAGAAFRARLDLPVIDGHRRGEFITAAQYVAFALRIARLAAGEQEEFQAVVKRKK